VRRELSPQIQVERPGRLLEAAGGAAVELEGDRSGRPFDRDTDGMGSENEAEK
jgi:hypothetical protein